ncbi:MAG: acetyl-CoA carboxylase biotin carboxylase subunit [Parasporobacterium sp.]|nr:acetyl-CoA carboxylase biotin carboxylase subunit [Parasporobacterium sp.]
MFSKILIANRGEIAVRIIRACKEMGISTVAVYSEADSEALHVALADESYCIGPYPADKSYLDEDRIISCALVSGAQAIHPGYGFLSENAHFAKACRKNGIVFIGPDPTLMEDIGDKTKIKQIISGTNLRPIPGTDVLESPEEAELAAKKIGYPVILKARSGGGGKGIRLVNDASELSDLFLLAVSEAKASFGDGGIYMEKYVFPARHIEVQILADEYGNVICLGERDCSIQRNHQKLLEETPSPGVTKEARDKLMADVTKAVRRLGYVGAGTLEFLFDQKGNFWFMEMNVRLQVEHCVTEMLTKIDLVKWQIRVAAGVELYITQNDVRTIGCAIECRINALTPGTIKMLHVPGGPHVRFDSYLFIGNQVPPYYDSLVGKLIVYARERDEAVRKMKAALCELVIEGIKTNIAEQLEIISDDKFMDGSYDLSFMEDK